MTITTRRILYIAFFLLFFIVSPLLLLYANGYRLDLQSLRLTKVGAIYIKTYPAGAQVYRDGHYTRRKTPTQIVDFPAGAHIISAVKDGYQTWFKELTVEPGKTTFIEDILLFKSSLVAEEIGSGGGNFLTTNDFSLAAYISTAKELTVLNLSTGISDKVTTLAGTSKLVNWSPDHNRLLFTSGNQWNIIDIRNKQTWSLTNQFKATITSGQFGSDSNNIWVLSQGTVWRLNLETAQKNKISENIRDLAISDDQLLLLTEKNHLLQGKLLASERQDYTLPVGNYSAIAEFHAPLAILVSNNQYSLWQKGEVIDKILASSYDWKKNRILFSSDYEIWQYGVDTQSFYLLDRSSILATMVRWHPSQSYLTYVRNGQLQIAEIDNRGEKRHLITVADLTVNSDYAYDAKGETIYLLSEKSLKKIVLQ